MKKTISLAALISLAAYYCLSSCTLGIGQGDVRDRNLEKALLSHLDSIEEVEYIGMSDIHDLDGNRFQAVLIYYVPDATGGKVERNVRVTSNKDGSEIYTWEDLDTRALENTKQLVNEKMEEHGINFDDSIIDTIIKLKKQIR